MVTAYVNGQVIDGRGEAYQGYVIVEFTLNPDGKIRFDSADGEFARARKMKPADLLDFLRYGR